MRMGYRGIALVVDGYSQKDGPRTLSRTWQGEEAYDRQRRQGRRDAWCQAPHVAWDQQVGRRRAHGEEEAVQEVQARWRLPCPAPG